MNHVVTFTIIVSALILTSCSKTDHPSEAMPKIIPMDVKPVYLYPKFMSEAGGIEIGEPLRSVVINANEHLKSGKGMKQRQPIAGYGSFQIGEDHLDWIGSELWRWNSSLGYQEVFKVEVLSQLSQAAVEIMDAAPSHRPSKDAWTKIVGEAIKRLSVRKE